MRLLIVAVMAAVMAACASIGHPEGGPRDEQPPRFVGSKPAPGTVNYGKRKIEIAFDENVKVDNPMDRVVVSPAQRTPASVIVSGKKVIVELRDSLLPNTTYTIDFSDAIRDLNEGNILDGFATDFSTGPERDSLQISGMVFEARNLEPAQGMIVGVYSNLADSAVTTLQLERIAKTNQLGQFTLRNLKPGEYRIFAIGDRNRDYHWDRSEDVAFYDLTIKPEASRVVENDTLVAANGTDSIVSRTVTRFTPDDVLLTWFNEDYKSLYVKDHARHEARKLSLRMSAPMDSLPELTIVNGPNAGRPARDWSILDTRPARDSLEYWITDPAVIDQDSLLIATRHQFTDSLDKISWTTDTIKFFFKRPKIKKDKKKEGADSVPETRFLQMKMLTGSTQELNKPLELEVSEPLADLPLEGIRLETLRDTVWVPEPLTAVEPDSVSRLRYRMPYKWVGGQKYRLTVDSAAVTSIYGIWNKPLRHEFTVKNDEDYANLIFKVSGDERPMVVELLNSSDKVVDTAPVEGGVAMFHFVAPGTYYARAFIDVNGNGHWDTGNLLEKIQPEEVYYYPQKINARKNWDIEQIWNIYSLALDMQKPMEIKKNKPTTKERDFNRDRDQEDDEDEFSDRYLDDQYNGRNRNGVNPPRGSRPAGGLKHNNQNQFAR